MEGISTLKLKIAQGRRKETKPKARNLYPALLFFLLRLKFDNDVMIKLGRAARLWNGPSLRGHKWRNGAKFQNRIKMACKQTQNKLADGVLNRLYVK